MNIPLLITLNITFTLVVISIVFYWLEYYFKWHRLLRYPNLDEVMYNIAIIFNALTVVMIIVAMIVITVQSIL